MIDDATLMEWELTPSPNGYLQQAIAEIRRLRECRTCGGAPHPSGKVCICGGTNFVEEELRQIRLALFAAEQDLAAHQAVVRELAEELDGIWLDPQDHPETVKRINGLLAHPLVVQARREGRG